MSYNLSSWSDLSRFGIGYLTGEACAYNRRILFDVTSVGKGHILSFLGLPDTTELLPPWNSRIGEVPTEGCILLPHCVFQDLAIFLLMQAPDVHVVVCKDGQVCGYSENEVASFWPSALTNISREGELVLYNPNRPSGRNTHQMSGRVE